MESIPNITRNIHFTKWAHAADHMSFIGSQLREWETGTSGSCIFSFRLDAAVGDFHRGFGESASFKTMEDQCYAWLDFSSHLFINALGCTGGPR